MDDGTCMHTLIIEDVGPKDAGITSVALSPDGRYVAAVSSLIFNEYCLSLVRAGVS
jgi:hypothetical protein